MRDEKLPTGIGIPLTDELMRQEVERLMTWSWRVFRPEVDMSKCKMCGICIEFCPEGNMIEYQERLCIDYEICKGCGVCATECPHKAIDMVREED